MDWRDFNKGDVVEWWEGVSHDAKMNTPSVDGLRYGTGVIEALCQSDICLRLFDKAGNTHGRWYFMWEQIRPGYKDFEGGVRYRAITKNGGRIVAVDPKFDCWSIVQALRPHTKWSKVSNTGSIIKAMSGEEQMTLLRMD